MNFEYVVDFSDADEEENSDAVLPSKGAATVKDSRKKRIGLVQSSTAGEEEMEIPEVNSPVNDEENSDEEVTDEEERIDTSPHDHEDDEESSDKNVGEKTVPEAQMNDSATEPSLVQRNEDVDLQSADPEPLKLSDPNRELSFGNIYSTGGQFDIGAATGISSDFSMLFPNDDWDVVDEDHGEKAAEEEESSDG
ncbi:serrate RNA effector molecule homolog [Papaver somniferum]|uniref:serrate RNA effector molecule homolog n=1 Tax=Papaver somniferum TaxID=3469 RepID=UPI000E7008FF|nr:serrate RNA effector molecule homolog [Papaver somniferum]